MRGILLAFFSLAVCVSVVAAGTIRQSVWFSGGDLRLSSIDGRTEVDMKGCDPTDEVGAPQLVQKTVFVSLPEGAVVQSVRLVSNEEQELDQSVTPAVVQPQTITMLGVKPRIAEANAAFFESESPYPAEPVRFAGQAVDRGQNVAMVTVFPLRYVASKHHLMQSRRIDFEVAYVENGKAYSSPLPASDGFDYLIVTNAGMIPAFQPLAQWKETKGLRTAIRDIAWIEASYPGRDAAEQLRNYLKACYPDSGLKWVMLGGDVGIVPLRYAYAMTCSANLAQREDSLPCDLYYSDLNGDWDRNGNNLFGEVADSVDLFPDVYVGRAPVNDTTEARIFVNKVLTYEQVPPTDYENTALFCAQVLWQDPYTDQGVAKNYIGDNFMPGRFNPIIKLYQSQGTENLDTVLAELCRGRNLFNHDGHGWWDAMGLGATTLRPEQVDTLTNAPRYGICYSIGCWTTAFDLDAIAEHFVRSPNGGTAAFIGNGSYGWGAPGNPRFGYSDRFDAEFYHQVFTNGVHSIGEALALDKVHFIPYAREANVYRWHEYEVNLMGDPEMQIWTDVPHHFVMNAPTSIPAGTTQLLVTVRDSLGRAVKGAVVSTQDDNGLKTARTDDGGQVMLTVTRSSAESLRVIATGAEFLPTGAQVAVVTGPYVIPIRTAINDSLGNNDHIANPGESLGYNVWFRNDGNQTAGNSNSCLRYSGPLLFVTDSVKVLPSLGPGDSTQVSFAFRISPAAADRDVADLSLVTSDSTGRQWTRQPAVVIGAPVLKLAGYRFSDSAPGGNGNGVMEPGETVNLSLSLHNTGLGYGYGAQAQVEVLDSNLSVVIGTTQFGTINPDSLAASAYPLVIAIASVCPEPYVARIALTETTVSGVFHDTISLVVGATGIGEDFESGAIGWETGGANDLWHLTTLRDHSPSHSFYCGSESTRQYVPGVDCWLRSPAFIAGPNPELRFWRWFSVPIYGSDGLYVIVEHESGGNSTAETLDFIGTGGALGNGSVDGITSSWFEEHYLLSRYCAGDTLRIQFGFKSDADAAVGEGFYIDDIMVATARAGAEERARPPVPNQVALGAAFPNPFKEATTIIYQLPVGAKTTLKVYAANGRLVSTPVNGWQGAGYHSVRWSTNQEGAVLPLGVYLCQLEVAGTGGVVRQERKLVVTR